MPHFFEMVSSDTVLITGENANHIINALRMKIGEKLTLCDNAKDYECEIVEINKDAVRVKVIDCSANYSEPDVAVTLYQCVPKGDKLELVIQKAVELGVSEIVPVLSSRCVSRPDSKKAKKKNERYSKIALSACEQSRRGKIVKVQEQMNFKQAVASLTDYDLCILFYEGGGEPLAKVIDKSKHKNIAIFIGPEGGFSDEEVLELKQNGAVVSTLGKRILRTETAPLASLVSIMLLTGNME